ncbi:MAG: ArsR/SmtB family transcription factor [Saprospiraceae bacterium]
MMVLTKKRTLDPEKINRVAEILKTIGHPVRLEILEVLEAEEPLAVSEIQERIGIPTEQSLLSHHLIKLKDKGLLRSEKRGMNVYYSLEDRKLLHIFDCMEQCTL